MFVKYILSCDKQNTSFAVAKVCLLRQNICHDKIMFAMTNACLSWQKFCCDKYVLCQTCVCHDESFCHSKHTFLATKDIFFMTNVFVATKVSLS